MKTIIILSIISGAFIVSSASGEEPVHFRDAILKAAVEDALWISDPTPTDMLGLTDFVCTNTINNGVKDLTGLEYAANLQTLLLSYNQISDLSPLAGLDHLQTLVLNDNQISNISALAGLSQLRHLNIHRNQISEISALAGLGNLQVLSLYLNRVSDISALAGLKGLQSLDLQQNAISDISVLAGLSQLQTLSLRQNHISDISALAGLTGLHNLDLNYNRLNNDSYCTYLQTLVANNRGMNLSYNPNRNPPTGVSASADPYEGTVQVIWNEVCNGPNYTSYYRVSRGTSEDGAKIPISAWQTSSSFEDVTAQPETSYIYWVQTATSSQGLDAGDYSSPKKDWSGKHALRISCTPGGSVTFPGQDLYLYGFGVMVPIQADPVDPDMYVFAGWTGSAVDAGKVADPKRASTTVTVDWDYTLKAHFVSVLTTIYVDDDAPEVPGPEEPSVDDPCENQCENGTPEHPFDSIQEAIEVAANNALIVVLPGTYCENIDLLGKRIHLTGFDPNYPMKRDPYPIIAGNGPGPIVQFASGEYLDCTLTGFVITRAKGPPGCAIYCSRSSPIIGNCLIVGNRSAQPNPAAVYCMESHAVFTHCTIADNDGGQQGAGLYLVDSNVVLTNSIVWGNTPEDIHLYGVSKPSITYADMAGGQAGPNNIDADPLFARPGHWADPTNPNAAVRPSDVMAVWSEGDYHLKSQTGRWDPKIRAWIQDKAVSPCIDAGDPASPLQHEPVPNGDLVNLGAYGGTAQASKSPLPGRPVFFPDAALKAAVEQALGKTDPTPTDMLGLTALDASLREISDLTGLEYATNLQTLDLSRNQIWHLSALSALSNLQWLSLNNNYISNISVVSGFTNLKYLDLHDQNSQKITDISPLAGLSQLNTAYLYRIGISNISILAGLHNIHTLYLEENLISDISPLLSMTSLVYLNILLNPLNQQACDLHIPQIRANNPGVSIVYRPCAPWSLTISSTAGGSVTSPGTGVFTYGHGALVQLQAQANPGFVFVNWSGTFFTTQNPTFVTIDQDHQIQANFAKLP